MLRTCSCHVYRHHHLPTAPLHLHLHLPSPPRSSSPKVTWRRCTTSSVHPHPHQTLATQQHTVETEVKKSKFLAYAWPVSSPEQALAHISAHRTPSASHNCFAYKIGPMYRSSDDGEPSGTAGRPILAAIEGERLDQVCVMVTRWFGGVKLGTGGLVRAYGGAARAVLQDAPRREVVVVTEVVAVVPLSAIGVAYQVADGVGAQRLSEEYGDSKGEGEAVLKLRLRVGVGAMEALVTGMQEGSGGRIRVVEVVGVGVDVGEAKE